MYLNKYLYTILTMMLRNKTINKTQLSKGNWVYKKEDFL